MQSLSEVVRTMRETATRVTAIKVGEAYLATKGHQPPTMEFWEVLHALYLADGQTVQASQCRLDMPSSPDYSLAKMAHIEKDRARAALQADQWQQARSSIDMARVMADPGDDSLRTSLAEIESSLRDGLFALMEATARDKDKGTYARALAREIAADEGENLKRRRLAMEIAEAENPRMTLLMSDWHHDFPEER